MEKDFIDYARRVLDDEIEGLIQTRDAVDSAFVSAVLRVLDILGAGGKIVVTGVGKNLHIAEKISATLASTGSTSVVLNPVQAMHGDLGMLAPADIVMALSFSGESEELIALIPAVKRLGVPVIAMTGKTDSTLAKLSEELLHVPVLKEACPFNMAPTTSTTATLALGDAFALVLMKERRFGKNDFALRHPAGAIGKALLYKVSDIMRTGDKIAVLKETDTVQDAVVEMTRVKAGSACITDAAGKLAGIFTDGDLRRRLADGIDVLNRCICDVMTANPVSVQEDALAVEVLRVFEKYKIDDLPVVDSTGCLAGYVDIQDLPRMKIL